jgi:hypothetical protein
LDSFDSPLDTLSARSDSFDSLPDTLGERLDSLGARLDTLGAQLDTLDSQPGTLGAWSDSLDSPLDSFDSRQAHFKVGLPPRQGVITTARPPKTGKNDSLALFAWLVTSQAFFIWMGSPTFRNILPRTQTRREGGCCLLTSDAQRESQSLWDDRMWDRNKTIAACGHGLAR